MSKKSFSIYFDGTGCDLLDGVDSPLTNVGKLFQSQDALGTDLSFNNGVANKYGQQVGPTYFEGEDEKIYLDGVGSGTSSYLRIYQGLTGEGAEKRINSAYEALVMYQNKYPTDEVDVNVVGFSRGAAQARAFCNQAIEKGVPVLDEQKRSTDKYLVLPGKLEINKLALFDTVASYGLGISDAHPGKDLQIHENIRSTTHLVALNEYRRTFPLTSALRKGEQNNRIEEIGYPGAHSQVGGGYKDDVLAAGPLAVMYERLKSSGMKMEALKVEDQQRILEFNRIITSPEEVVERLIDSRMGSNNSKKPAFPMEKGFLDPWNKQDNPFEHPVDGRKIIYEFNDDLCRDFGISDLLMLNYEKHKTHYVVEQSVELKDVKAETKSKLASATEQFEKIRNVFDEKMLNDVMSKTVPAVTYIKSFNFQPVPLATPNVNEPSPYDGAFTTSFVENIKKSDDSHEGQAALAKQEKVREWRENRGDVTPEKDQAETGGPRMG